MHFKLRVELWDNCINIPPKIQSNIENVHDKLHQIMKNIASHMSGWKYIERHEASISTENGEKQIRHIDKSHKPNAFIEFGDQHSSTKENLSIDEWKEFAKFLEYEINDIIHARCGVLLISDISS
jgi:hypothetical protein